MSTTRRESVFQNGENFKNNAAKRNGEWRNTECGVCVCVSGVV